MQGLVNFGQQIALIVTILLPSFLYASAIGFFLWSGWAFWEQAQDHNPYRSKPWLPFLALIMCGFCASFPGIMTMVNASAGSDITVGISAELTSYDSITAPTSILGDTLGDTILNIVNIFLYFFQSVGVMTCFLAALAWWKTQKGTSQRSPGGCYVQFVFGDMLINIYTISTWLVTTFST